MLLGVGENMVVMQREFTTHGQYFIIAQRIVIVIECSLIA
jgi:hypothetical protein